MVLSYWWNLFRFSRWIFDDFKAHFLPVQSSQRIEKYTPRIQTKLESIFTTKMRFAPSHPSFDAIQFHLFNNQFMNIHFYREFIIEKKSIAMFMQAYKF